MRSKLLAFMLVIIFTPGICIVAIGDSIKIMNYSFREGLTTSGVNSVFKDSKGFLWICANNGLFRYDGHSFKNINSLAKELLKYETYCIAEDKNQNLWIGTAGKGVVFYNTQSGRLFNLNLSEGNNSKVNRILFHQGKIWIATNAGLIVLDENQNLDPEKTLDAVVLWPDPVHKNFQMNVINFVYARSGEQSLWVGTNSSLYELNINSYQFRLINSQNQNSIRWLSDYSNDNILASSWDGGVFCINTENLKMENDPFIQELNSIIGNKRVKSAVLDKQGNCWVATFGEGLYVFRKDDAGNVNYENHRNDDDFPLRLKSNFLDQIYLDDSGIAWISMAEGGLSKVYFEKNIFQYHRFAEPEGSHKVKEILGINKSIDEDKFWVTFNRNEIDLFDSKTLEHRQFTTTSKDLKLQNDKVSLTYQDSKGNLWIVYSRIGLYVVPSKAAQYLVSGNSNSTIVPLDANNLLSPDPRANSYITSFYEDSKERLWIGAWGSAYVFEHGDGFGTSSTSEQLKRNSNITLIYAEERKEEVEFTISPVSSILEVDENNYWLGTRDAGIIILEETSELRFKGKHLELNDIIPSKNIKCLYADQNQRIWVGTNSGLCYLDLNKGIINMVTGLTSESISNILEDKNQNIWVSTSYGISKINSVDLSVTNLFNSDDEKYNQYIGNAVSMENQGKLWFTTRESMVLFRPDSLVINDLPAPLYFTDIKINNHKIVPNEKYQGVLILEEELNSADVINVPYGSTLNIEFAAINYLNPERSFYRYKIGNNDWTLLTPGQRSLILSNMNPGQYTLSVRLAEHLTKNSERTVTINNLPPFWLSKVAYALYLSIALILLFTYRRLIIQKILQKSLIEKERFERRKIEELDKMKTEFLANISHEFRTPLSLIINPLEKLVVQEDITPDNKNRLKLVLRSSNRLLKLTNELMDFSKIEQDILKPDFHICEIVSATNEICMLFTNLADTTNIEFKFNHSFDQLEIAVDKGMFEKVIFNLLSNAFKYTPLNGIIMVNISKANEANKDYAKISVINTGEGISKENQKMIFDRYFQVNNVQNRKIEGTGIGLALVKSFVELHHGRVDVSSDPTLETCFDVYFPVIQEGFGGRRDGNVRSTESAITYNGVLSQSGPKVEKPASQYRVLVVEDEEDIRNYLIDELSNEYNVLSAANGEEGLKIANKIIPDLIITDLMMPILNGIDLSHTLKNQVITSHIPIIILSAKIDIKQQIEGLEKGADVYLTKPFNMDYLKAQILRLINFKQAVYSRFLKDTFSFPIDAVSNQLDKDFMQKVLAFVNENLTNSDLNVDQLAQYVAFSKVQTYRKIKAISGMSIVEFIRSIRLKKAAQLIMDGHLNFSEIAYETGFSTPSYFSKCFHDHFGITPSEFVMEYGEKKKVVHTP